MTVNKFTKTVLQLKRGALISLTQVSHLEVICRSGALWITTERDAVDYRLTPGESMVVRSSGKIVIEALQNSEIQLTALPSKEVSLVTT